ncbi:transcriptional regulator BetI [Acinetobacter sp. B5B]|uniref:transcriptional regulator BetI n=1 Tax=Acinetobacter baretiae TaxID=2605383 RepID=UPI0018C21F37|nr:transcriptional regulator BetI [Acinetobacter baretiae]MBF7683048.1 transcriptional regulator BetI [Acinetobacter baretiae]MBF7684300.1 transcriptional regulator BetI [Acinetobacter baretiae]
MSVTLASTSRIQPEHVRREQIIQAAFEVIASLGLTNTTIAKIAKQAGLSTGIVSHYFGDKQGLITACMREMLAELQRKTMQNKAHRSTDSIEQIQAIIDSNFDNSQTNAKAMRLWLEFWTASMHMPALQRLQRINSHRLYSNLKYHLQQILPKTQVDTVTQALAALIDGLWLRASLMSHQENFDVTQARYIAYHYLEMHTNTAQKIQTEN